MLRSKSKSVQCWQYLHAPTSNIATQPNFLATSWKKCVEKSRRQFNLLRNMLLQLARTKFWCVTIFEVGGNTVLSTTLLNLQRNNVLFASFCNLLLVSHHSNAVRAFSRNVRHRFPDIGSTSTLCILVSISTLPTQNTERLLYLLRTTSVCRRPEQRVAWNCD